MKTVDEILSKYKVYETPNGNDAIGYDSVIEAMKEISLVAYDAGFKDAAENFSNNPTGKPVQSIAQFIKQLFPN